MALRRQLILFVGILCLCLCFQVFAHAEGTAVKEGDRGDDVRRVQLLLISGGYLEGEADGVCGKKTVAAIERFQKEAGLEADGVCGNATFALLEKQAKEREAMNTQSVPVGGVVKLGLHGPGVARVQVLLIAKGYLDGEPDGVCGTRTAGAIARFQKESGLKADGVCGPLTYARLENEEVPPEEETRESSLPVRKGHVVYVSATAYSAFEPGNSKRTALGTRVRRGIIAVDPSFIPLGTRVFIPGYGEAVAEDTGLDIKGNRIDVAFDTYEEAMAFGRQDIELYIME